MDSLDPTKEIDRNAECADKVYASLCPDGAEFKSMDALAAWHTNLRRIVEQYNLSVLFPILDLAYDELGSNLNDSHAQKVILSRLHNDIAKIIDRRKLDIAAVYFDAQDTINIPPFKVERGEIEDDIYIDNCLLIYDVEKNGNKKNNQWKPLLIAFIKSNRHTLLETTIEDVAHTSRGSSLDKCVSKLNGILKQNYILYREMGKTTHKVLVKKHRGDISRYLEIE